MTLRIAARKCALFANSTRVLALGSAMTFTLYLPVAWGQWTSCTSGSQTCATANVGIGTTAPGYTLDVNGFGNLGGGARIGSTGGAWLYYPNVVSYTGNGMFQGSIVIHTNIARNSSEMFKLHVIGYGYNTASNVDFVVVGYAYSAANGNIDGALGAIINYSAVDSGNDALQKWVGVDASGKVAVAFGDPGTSYYYYRTTVDYYSTIIADNASSGWSIDRSTTPGFGWKDLHTINPAITQTVGGYVGIGISSPSSLLNVSNNSANVNAGSNTVLRLSDTNSVNAGTGVGVGFEQANTNGSLILNASIDTYETSKTPGSEASDLRFATISSGTLAERMRIAGAGNVGIGTTAPQDTLQVDGTFRLGFQPDDSNYYLQVAPTARQSGLVDYLVKTHNVSPGTNTVLDIGGDGNVGIGTVSPLYRLSVKGTIGAQEVIVTNTSGWSDYVFTPNYRLRPLTEVSSYIREHHHLPEIPSEAEVQQNGVSLGDMQTKLLAKIEELTLHLIEANERIARLEARAVQQEH